ncbi:hypothetical protein QA640_09835 [Bradyrhizobium sp. CB82]|uniref:hypothetical protein n=1 Tax=Bradyrhizobium sp. CB82 TaxID=3039159 RepID=UPI0024B24C36|nr:hypothetical protein [Bradyrhizobium sp. CB82]WFU42728.1 hypothetical protein QA640_09835 [Bradyrhizobium sp. CB82]
MSALDDYFAVSANQLAARGRVLLGKIPRDLSPHYGGLVTITQDRLNRAIEGFLEFSNPSARPLPEAVRQRQFRRMVEELDLIESTALTALNRASDDDLILTHLVTEICREVKYPLLSPVVSATSQRYFGIYPGYKLMMVPLTEGHFLLHLPDIYHELAHPLLAPDNRNDPRIEPFRKAWFDMIEDTSLHFESEIATVRRGRSPERLATLLNRAELAWAGPWGVEFFCDVFATCTVGPAFAWSHLHLHSKRGALAFSFPQTGSASHPADDARMQIIVATLDRLGFAADARTVADRWAELVQVSEPSAPPEFRRCYPPALLKSCVASAIEATAAIGCDFAAPSMSGRIRRVLNDAWTELWAQPTGYLNWERGIVGDLRSAYSPK